MGGESKADLREGDESKVSEGSLSAGEDVLKSKLDAGTISTEGVVYLGHIPHGFYEDQMSAFFKQFGVVKRLRLSRSKKTGRSRGYAFIQFENKSVAEVVVKAMDKYILCDRVLECKLLDAHRVHPRMFAGARRRDAGRSMREQAMKSHNATRTRENEIKRALRLLSAEERRRKKMKRLNVEYDFPGYKSRLR